MKKLLWITSLLLLPGISLADNDICVHLNGGEDVAYLGEYNTLEIWVANDLDLKALQFTLEVCWQSGTTVWHWNMGYGSSPPFDRHGDAAAHLPFFADDITFDNVSCETFAAGAAGMPGDKLPPGSSRLCYSLEFGLPSQPVHTDVIQVQPYAYFGSMNWFFMRTNDSRFPPDFCGQPVASMDIPTASPVTFNIIERPCGDVDCNYIVNISDAVYMITYIFGGGPAPCAGCP